MRDCDVFPSPGRWSTHGVLLMLGTIIFCYSQHSWVKSLMWQSTLWKQSNSVAWWKGRKRGKSPRLPECIMYLGLSWGSLLSRTGLLLFPEKKMTGFHFLTMRHPLPARCETDLKNYARCSRTASLSCSLSFSLSLSLASYGHSMVLMQQPNR